MILVVLARRYRWDEDEEALQLQPLCVYNINALAVKTPFALCKFVLLTNKYEQSHLYLTERNWKDSS